MPWSADEILAESAAWYWVPPGSEEIRTTRIQLFLHDGTANVIGARPSGAGGDTAGLVEDVRVLAGKYGAERVRWRLGPRTVPADLPRVLRAAGAEVERREQVCSLDLTDGVPALPVPANVEVRRPRSAGDQHAYGVVAAEVWGGEPPSEQDAVDEFAARDPSQPGGGFVAYHQGRPAGAAGYTLTGRVARLWGAGVRPELRGHGVYRALVAARLADAVANGATLGLVHATVDTSAPILRRLGFSGHGENVVCTLSFAPPWVEFC